MAQKHDRTAAAVGISLFAIAATATWVLTDQPAAEPTDTTLSVAGISDVASCDDSDCGSPTALPPVGEPVAEDSLHVITHPGRYGLAEAPSGSRYGVISGRLVRVHANDGQLLSVLRHADRILD